MIHARLSDPVLLIGEVHPIGADWSPPARDTGGIGTAPITFTMPMPEPVKERYLTIRKTKDFQIVTVIEVLSPANNRAGSDDRSACLTKRDGVVRSGINLVKLVLLRGCRRLPSIEPVPFADFFAIISRTGERPRAAAYPWTIRQAMPTIPIPLADGDPDVMLDLQAVYSTVYEYSGYEFYLQYSFEVEPVLAPDDLEWVTEVLRLHEQVRAGL